ncbi:MAG: hypothetical protein KDD50_05465, partial [Bdellovibrionales bacterium]|nr:hypothetical protein [Bdellovibrionales bacterium]
MKLALGILILIFSTSIWAQTKSDSFLKLFEVSRIKSTNEIEYIYTQEKSRFSMIQYIQYMKQEVKDYMEYIKDHPEETELFNQQEINLLNLKKYNIQSKHGETSKGEQFLKLLDDPDVQALAKDFDEQVQKIPLKPNLLAAPSNSKYFYKLRIIEELFDWVFNRIEDSARTLPHYSAIRYLFYMAINNMIDRQRYYQTLMQHYLDDPELVA